MKRLLVIAISAFQLFSVSAGALTYAEWIAGYPSLTGGNASATADPDGDGLVNLLEYALDGMDPTAPTSQANNAALPKSYFILRAADGSYGSPVTVYSQSASAAAASLHMAIRYKPRPGVTDIRYVPETNQMDLTHWGWGDSAVTNWEADGYTWSRTLSDMKVWGGQAFMRLRVEVIE